MTCDAPTTPIVIISNVNSIHWIVAVFPILLNTCDLKGGTFVTGNQCCSAELIIAWRYIWREGRIRFLTAATAYLYKCAICFRFDLVYFMLKGIKGCKGIKYRSYVPQFLWHFSDQEDKAKKMKCQVLYSCFVTKA